MDLVPLIDWLGEDVIAAAGGLAVGLLFGFFAQRSRFCLRSAVIEFGHGTMGAKVAVWLLAFSGAVAGTQLLIDLGWLSVTHVRQLAARGSLSGALIGGLMFGAGMVLSRGCASRLLVLSANGNLRALLSGLVFAVTAQASLRGAFAPLREVIAGWWTIGEPGSLDLLAVLGLGERAGLWLGLSFLAVALLFAVFNRVGPWAWVGGLGVGAMIAAGWLLTYSLSLQAFEVVPVESITFSGPSADTLMLLLMPRSGPLNFHVGLVPGVFLGSFLGGLLGRDLKLEGFEGGRSMRRYIAGAALMGFGAMLAGGCSVGAGITGGSVFALTGWVTLSGIWAAATLTDFVLDRPAAIRPGLGQGSLRPAP
ncbi:MAG: YeeE/YedE family protein [Azospirillum sp.]|nr:YeeE/YedE family protein [Azospirillum sp.]